MPYDLCNSEKDYKTAIQHTFIESTSNSTICKQNHKGRKQFKTATVKNKKNTQTQMYLKRALVKSILLFMKWLKKMRNDV